MSRLDDTAKRLRDAYLGQTIEPLRGILEPADVNGAYAVQQINTDYWSARGRTVVGRKVGLTSAAVRQQLGVDQPDFGVLFDDMQIRNDGYVSPADLIQPKAEAEVAIILARDIENTDCDYDDIVAATDCAVAAIEIVDSRIQDWKITFADTVADNGSSAKFVLGDTRVKLDGLDLYTCGMVMEVNGEVASVGAGAACLGHPLKAAVWLARTLAVRGTPLRAGDILLTGALGPMVTLNAGDHIEAKIGGLGRCSFTYEEAK